MQANHTESERAPGAALKKIGASAGTFGPLLFAGVFLVEGLLRPGYSAIAQSVSALSLGPRGFVQIANFLVFGGLLSVFAVALRREFRRRRISTVAPTLLVGIGVALFISGPCVMDPTTTPRAQLSMHGLVHGIAGAYVFSVWPILLVLAAVAIRRDAHWRALLVPTLVAGLVALSALVVMTATKRPPGVTPWAYAGLIQRIHICSWLAWSALAGLRLARA
jgi:hypothetical protein